MVLKTREEIDQEILKANTRGASAREEPLRGDRKGIPLFSGVLAYFPDALVEVARLSQAGNQKHNPGAPLHWARGKSMDHADCIVRHLLEYDDTDPEDGILHATKVAWRALALLQEELEARGAPVSRGSRG